MYQGQLVTFRLKDKEALVAISLLDNKLRSFSLKFFKFCSGYTTCVLSMAFSILFCKFSELKVSI